VQETGVNAGVGDITEETLQPAACTIARAFRADPLYMHVFDSIDHYDQVAPWMIETWTRWCMRYGKAWATPNLDAVALRRVPNHYHISLWSLFRTGIYAMPRRLGKASMKRFGVIIRLLEQQHSAIMGHTPHWYCWILAVTPERQGHGVGKVLMRHTFQHADRMRLPCYLETMTETNVQIHGSQGYVLRNTIQVPASDLKLYLMVRPETQVTVDA
jgi:GNAT superfamily N-acetyltransferase